MNKFPAWKNALVIVVVFLGLLYALPNVFDQDPAIEVIGHRDTLVDATTAVEVRTALEAAEIPYKRVDELPDRLLIRFRETSDQLRAQEVLQRAFLGRDYVAALTLSADVPDWLTAIGAKPMYLGLDLRGGIHVLIDVDMETAVAQAVNRYAGDIRDLLRNERIRYGRISEESNGVTISFNDAEIRDRAFTLLDNELRDLSVSRRSDGGNLLVTVRIADREIQELQRLALQQNIITLRNRVNQMGVAEPIVQQQGDRRIVVQLPGANDPAQIKNILSATATLEYRLEDTETDIRDALEGRVPHGSRLYQTRDGRPILLRRQVIVTGNQITNAGSGIDQRTGSPMVTVSLDGPGGRRMRNVTNENVGKPMAVVFIETRTETREVDGELVSRRVLTEEVISVANILEPFGSRFQTTGLSSGQEAHNLALLLRAGALAAPIEIVEERTIGPSLGQESIEQGFLSVMIGLALVILFMGLYYRVFGLVANLALVLNLVLIVAVLSLLQAVLTLPGIAGIVLTVGMAVDANVLIFQRIREEIKLGNTPQASISAGYDKALSTIVDANITTLIAAAVLYGFGTGPIKGFAVTLFIGILTSMFTALIGTRAVINLIYGGKRVTKLAI